MSKILQIAWREFVSTAGTKAFVVGVLIFPAMIAIFASFVPSLLNRKPPPVAGQVAVLDESAVVFDDVAAALAPAGFLERREESRKRIDEAIEQATPEALQRIQADERGKAQAQQMVETMLGDVPQLEVVRIDESVDLEKEKELVKARSGSDRIALIRVHRNAVEPDPSTDEYGAYDLYLRDGLDEFLVRDVKRSVRNVIVDARIESRLGEDPDVVRRLTDLGRVVTMEVTDEGVQETHELFNEFLPMAFMFLIFLGVMTGGQYLMTTTIEEKSSRVVEVILSAVSPMQLMSGKILGQLLVGFVLLIVYAGMGLSLLVFFSLFGLLKLHLIAYLIVFYLISYFVIASLMAAVGSAVNELREAQALMTPIMLVVMLPWILWIFIAKDPNSTFATVTSFLPPINGFVMMLRLSSASPPPHWQAILSIVIGLVAVYAALWFAGKVFRIGLLMHGKPPTFATLLRWVRMA